MDSSKTKPWFNKLPIEKQYEIELKHAESKKPNKNNLGVLFISLLLFGATVYVSVALLKTHGTLVAVLAFIFSFGLPRLIWSNSKAFKRKEDAYVEGILAVKEKYKDLLENKGNRY